ncbi:MAG TPA: VOC family protein [Caulobacteraceae bacterium]|jgi:predicted 3-demethylubiquinone-9 3-methyltransferase (glyoxalase superfamily)
MTDLAICLWFDTDGEAAAKHYVETFQAMGRPAELGAVARYGPEGPRPAGTAMTVRFTLDGLEFMALNGGPEYRHSPAFSLMVDCSDQSDIDGFWDRLVDGGRPIQCGWLTDRFGVSWQIVPRAFERLVGGGDAARSSRVMKAMFGMVKLDIEALEKAAEAA